MNKTHEISNREWNDCKDYFNSTCAYCGTSEEDALKDYNQHLHKEHVSHNGSNDLSNCVPSCKGCNSSKHIATLEEWYNEENPVFDQQRLDKIIKWLNKDYLQFKE